LGAERARWILWVPVGLAVGIGVYFALTRQPPVWVGPAIFVAALAVAGLGRRHDALLLPALAVVTLAAGFMLADWRTLGADHVVLERPFGPTRIQGQIDKVESLPDGTRLVLDKVRITALQPPATPERVRLRLRGSQPELKPGQWIQVQARLSPPPPPAMPGAYDFQFLFYFDEIGATGFALGRARVLAGAEAQPALAHRWEGFRQHLTERIRGSIGGPAGAVAAALITGDRSAIPETLNAAYRDSGIAHLLSISGLHIGLVAGILFAGIRAALALFPAIALRYPIKKWAAVAAIAGALFYTLLAGATVPTQRSFVMMGLVLLAVILDRQGISMRFVAVAAAAILAVQPEALLNASFQMSFAAVIALIAAYESWGRAFARNRDSGWMRRIALYVAGVCATTIIATAATAPFAIYHFNRVALFSLLGNLIAVPLSSVWVMPAAVIGMVLVPFGLEDFGLKPMGWGVDVINAAAAAIAAADWAVTILPAMPGAALVAMVGGGLWLCLWRRTWRWAGAVPIAAGIGLAVAAVPPDILADGEGRLFALTSAEGRLLVSSRTTARFEREIWLRRVGFDAAQELNWSSVGAANAPRCDAAGCIAVVKGEVVAFATDRAALADDCREATILISAVPVRGRRCPSAHTVIDRFDLWRHGTHALWLKRGGIRVESVNGVRGARPWVVRPGMNRPTPSQISPQTPSEPADDEDEVPPEPGEAAPAMP
jgi:competence protein ComEC